LETDGAETKLWATPEGVILRQESPTGLVLLKQEAWKIFDAMLLNRPNNKLSTPHVTII